MSSVVKLFEIQLEELKLSDMALYAYRSLKKNEANFYRANLFVWKINMTYERRDDLLIPIRLVDAKAVCSVLTAVIDTTMTSRPGQLVTF